MIVLRRLASGVWDHAGARFTEWLGLVPLMGMGVVLYAQPGFLATTASFVVLAAWASAGAWSNMVLSCGLLRLIALAVNGTFRQFPYSPLIRFFASAFAAMFWMLFTVGFYTAWRDGGGAPTPIIAYGTLMLLELRNAYVSRVDMAASARGRGHAGTNR